MNKPKKKPAFKLYVWDEFAPDYTSGLAFAIATDEKDARKQVIFRCGFEPSEWGKVQVFPLNKRIAFKRYGGS